jgi:hypothetical protein
VGDLVVNQFNFVGGIPQRHSCRQESFSTKEIANMATSQFRDGFSKQLENIT